VKKKNWRQLYEMMDRAYQEQYYAFQGYRQAMELIHPKVER